MMLLLGAAPSFGGVRTGTWDALVCCLVACLVGCLCLSAHCFGDAVLSEQGAKGSGRTPVELSRPVSSCTSYVQRHCGAERALPGCDFCMGKLKHECPEWQTGSRMPFDRKYRNVCTRKGIGIFQNQMPRQWLGFGGRQQQSAHNTSSGVIKKSENKSKRKQTKAKQRKAKQ
jgi:hypothetical protein